MSESTPAAISYLPSTCGDGYNYGGGLIVTFGELALNLGGIHPMSGGYEHQKLAEQIVESFNSHAALVAERDALRKALELIESAPYGHSARIIARAALSPEHQREEG